MTPDVNFGLIYSRLHSEVPVPDFAQPAEELGFAGVWVTEGLVNEQPALDPLIALQAFASCTQTITVGTCVVLLPLRNPVILAKEVASVDLLSGGRVVLGVGVGGSRNSGRDAFAACGIRAEERGARADEALEVMKKLWTGKQVSHHGRFHDFEQITMEPRPQQRPGPPIWTGGGRAEPVLKRTARWCDGWVPTDLTAEEYMRAWQQIHRYAREYGRDSTDIVKALHIYLSIDDDNARARDVAAQALTARYGFAPRLATDSRYLFGTPDDCVAVLEPFVSAGITDFILNVTRPLPEVMGQIELFSREVLPRLNRVAEGS